MCHDYKAPGRDDSLGNHGRRASGANNVHVHDGMSEDDFVAMRNERDKTLVMPNLILPSVQVNMRGGNFPPPEDNGTRYLKIPLNAF